MLIRILTLAVVAVSIPSSHSLTPDETCALCQTVLKTVYGHFSANIPSRKKLSNQLNHECKRHYNYRRRCLLMVKDQTEMIYREMTATPFKPLSPCYILKECKLLQSPIVQEVPAMLPPSGGSNTDDEVALFETLAPLPLESQESVDQYGEGTIII